VKAGTIPPRDEAVAAAKAEVSPAVSVRAILNLRRDPELTPEDWRRPGRRSKKQAAGK